jgi:hypothetical protein
MPKRDSIASNSYKYGSISVKYRFFFVFSRFPPVFRFFRFFSKNNIEYFGFQKTSFFFGLLKNRLTLFDTLAKDLLLVMVVVMTMVTMVAMVVMVLVMKMKIFTTFCFPDHKHKKNKKNEKEATEAVREEVTWKWWLMLKNANSTLGNMAKKQCFLFAYLSGNIHG